MVRLFLVRSGTDASSEYENVRLVQHVLVSKENRKILVRFR